MTHIDPSWVSHDPRTEGTPVCGGKGTQPISDSTKRGAL
jgi:hypothetical protein